ncbi:hypothetical protein BT246_22220 [Bacillus thuringiensis]|uniref:Uncharacterized protein n=1 Tax=Bacillus thuringiensis TaxID=1428 RepID=A0A9W3WZS8_BACTU|nr:hypothetical protein [Bacillus thuringiensis]ANS47596.1 hypothetical protein BT246_22220 [Bacillus thuringiensis]
MNDNYKTADSREIEIKVYLDGQEALDEIISPFGEVALKVNDGKITLAEIKRTIKPKSK